MKRKVKITLDAEIRLGEIQKYAASKSESFADRLISRLKVKTSLLKKGDMDGRPIPELEDPNVRQLLLDQYRIIYRIISETEVHVLVYWHSAKPLNPDEDLKFEY